MANCEKGPFLLADDILCDTKSMGEAADKDSAVQMFEPMSQEALERQKRDFPLNTPLDAAQRKEAVEWLLAENGGGVSVKLKPPYDNPDIRDALVESMLLHSWFIPSKELENRILLKGSSAHRVGSATIPLTLAEEPERKVDVAIKPSNAKKARLANEMARLESIRRRGISAVEPLGLIEIKDAQGHSTYFMTILKKGLVPLQKINFEQLHTRTENKYRQLNEFLEELGKFTANIHNRGVTHGDLHLRNVGYDVTQGTRGDFVTYDVERSTVISDDKLIKKNNLSREVPQELAAGFEDFERKAIDDIASLTADISAQNENVPKNLLLRFLVKPYMERRSPSHGRPTTEQFLNQFDTLYNKKLEKLRAGIEINRRILEKQGAANPA